MKSKQIIYDTHCHVNISPLKENCDEIIAKCKEKNMILNIVGVDYETSILAIEIAKKYDYCYAVIGIHPNDASKMTLEQIDYIIGEFDLLIKKNRDKIVGIGETGFDFFHDKIESDYFMQYESFKKHFDLAKKYNLPIVVHTRNAFLQTIDFINNNKYGKYLIHCFCSSLIELKEYQELGCMISIPGIVTFKNALDLKEAVKYVNTNLLLVETDSPFLAPSIHRSKTNFPYYLDFVITEIASILNLTYEEVALITTKNAKKFFLNKKN